MQIKDTILNVTNTINNWCTSLPSLSNNSYARFILSSGILGCVLSMLYIVVGLENCKKANLSEEKPAEKDIFKIAISQLVIGTTLGLGSIKAISNACNRFK